MSNRIGSLASTAVLVGGAALLASCATEESSRVEEVWERSAKQCKGSELHVFGSYQARSSSEGPPDPNKPWPPPRVQRDSYVRIDRPGEHKIVLSAYEPVKWHVSAAPGADITNVLVVGYHEQAVVLDGVKAKVDIESYEQGGAARCGYSWPYNGQGCDTQDLIDWATEKTGQALTSFHGCYQVDQWKLRPDLSAESNCGPVGSGYEQYEWIPPPSDDASCPGDPAGAEVQVVGVYETRSDHGGGSHPIGSSVVKVDRPGDQILVVSSYEPTDWKIEAAPGVNLLAVYAVGYHQQTVQLAPGLKPEVKTFSSEAGDTYVSCGYRLPSVPHGCQTEDLLRWTEEQTGLKPTSFRGCYRATRWGIGKELETSTDCQSGELTEKIFLEK